MTNEKQNQILGENTIPTKYNPNLAEQVTRQIEQEEKQALIETKINPITNPINYDAPLEEGFVYVPSINRYLGKHTRFKNSDWYHCHRQLQQESLRMPTIPEFIEFVKYLKANPQGVKDATSEEIKLIQEDILKPKDDYIGEWLDARFTLDKNNQDYIGYHHIMKDGLLIPDNKEPLEDCLMQDQRIDLDSWLNNHTKQGLPKVNCLAGNLNYNAPMPDTLFKVAKWGKLGTHNICLNCLARADGTEWKIGARPTMFIPRMP